MNTILIPLDFSVGTQNVLNFIASASKDIAISRVILLKSMYTSVYQPIIATAEYMCLNEHNFEIDRQEAMQHMTSLTQEFLEKVDAAIKVDNAFSEWPLPRAIIQTIKQEKPDLLMLNSGIAGNEGYISNNLIQLVTISTIPVLVIPPNAKYNHINTVMIPIDFEELNRLEIFHHPLITHNVVTPFLKVFSIKKNQKRDELHDHQNLSTLLKGFPFSVHYSSEEDILKGILNFAEEINPELIVALPGKYNFFKKLTHRSIAQAIANKSNHPVLILKKS